MPRIQMTASFAEWLRALPDRIVRARIQVRIDRLAHGNPGDHRHLDQGVCEMRLHVGPGYRVYYTYRGDELIVLLAGGDKQSQQRDIEFALTLANEL